MALHAPGAVLQAAHAQLQEVRCQGPGGLQVWRWCKRSLLEGLGAALQAAHTRLRPGP